MSRTPAVRPRRGTVLTALVATIGVLTGLDLTPAAAHASTPVPTPITRAATHSVTAPKTSSNAPSTSTPATTIRVGPVSVSVDVPGTIGQVRRTVRGAVRTVDGTLSGSGRSSSPKPSTGGRRSGAAGTATSTGHASSGGSATATHTERVALSPRRGYAAAALRQRQVTPRDRQQVATTTGPRVSRSPSNDRAPGPASSPRALRRFTRLQAPLFHPGPTVMLLMAFTVGLALLVLLMLFSVGRRTDPRIVASADRLRSGRTAH